MRGLLLAIATGLVSVAVSTIESIIGLHHGTFIAVLPGLILGLWGGAAAAIMPWGETSWGVKKAIRVLALGMITGSAMALWLMDIPLTEIGPGRRMLYEAAAGFLAEQILQASKVIGRESAARALRKTQELALRVIKPEEPKNE